MRLKRNIVPVIDEGFDFEKETEYLPEAWRGEFGRLSGMRLLHDYFEEGMEKLRKRFLKQPVYGVAITPTPPAERWEVEKRVEAAASDRVEKEDEIYHEAVELVRRLGKASVSLLQRRLRIGYTRAAAMITMMEERGVVGPAQIGSKPREVLPMYGVEFKPTPTAEHMGVEEVVSQDFLERDEFGTDWTADFFNNPDLAGLPVLQVSDINGINFNWGTGQPIVNGQTINIGPDVFSIRFSSVQALSRGTYQFAVTADDGVRMYIDDQLVLDRFQSSSMSVTNKFKYHARIPGFYSLKVEYFEGIGNANIQVSWRLVD